MRADLHIHSVLSPCGDIEMSPKRIVSQALAKGLDMIAITDHNTTLQCEQVVKAAEGTGLSVLCGAELTTREEAHILVYAPYLPESTDTSRPGSGNLADLQSFIDAHLPSIKNKPSLFGYQLVVDQDENVLYEEERLLISALLTGMDEIIAFAHTNGFMVVPAHIDKPKNSLLSQLGFIPVDLDIDAVELSALTNQSGQEELLTKHPLLNKIPLMRSSDAHYPEEIGRCSTHLDCDCTFEGLKQELKRLTLQIQNT